MSTVNVAPESWGAIPGTVTYVLNYAERLQYRADSASASVLATHAPYSRTNVDLSVVVNVPPAAQKSATITSFSITGNVVTIVAPNSFSPGDIVGISGLSTGTYLNGQNLTVSEPTGSQFKAAFTHADAPGCWYVDGTTYV